MPVETKSSDASTRPSEDDFANGTSESAILLRLIFNQEPLSREASRWLLAMRHSERDVALVKALSEKAKSGTLTAEEDETLEHYLNVGRILEYMKSKARQRLRELGDIVRT